MSEKAIFTVTGPDDAGEQSIEERVQAALEYADLMGTITEGLGLETDVEQKLHEAVRLARLSHDDNLLKRASSKVIDHYRKLKKVYVAGTVAIGSGQGDKALGFIRELVGRHDWAKALDLARRMGPGVVDQTRALIEAEQRRHDRDCFDAFIQAEENRHHLVYLVKSFDPEFQGAYYLKRSGSLGRNYELLDGFVYAGTVVKKDVLERFRHYEPRSPYREAELMHRLFHMHEELARAKVSLVQPVDFLELAEMIDGFLSLVGINHAARSLLITEPVVRCIRRPE